MSGSNHIQPDNQFVYRLISAKCSYGSMSHPLNVAEAGAVMEYSLAQRHSQF